SKSHPQESVAEFETLAGRATPAAAQLLSVGTCRGPQPTKSRWTLWLLAFAGVGLAVWLGPRLVGLFPARITQATCDRIRLGMTMAEVESLLGRLPAGSWDGYDLLPGSGPPTEDGAYERRVWVGPSGERIQVYFRRGVVSEKRFTPAPLPPDPSSWFETGS